MLWLCSDIYYTPLPTDGFGKPAGTVGDHTLILEL